MHAGPGVKPSAGEARTPAEVGERLHRPPLLVVLKHTGIARGAVGSAIETARLADQADTAINDR
jgi:hypothetical protein